MTPEGFRAALLHAATTQDAARMERLVRARAWGTVGSMLMGCVARWSEALAWAMRRLAPHR